MLLALDNAIAQSYYIVSIPSIIIGLLLAVQTASLLQAVLKNMFGSSQKKYNADL